MYAGRISLILPTKNEEKYLAATLAQFEGLLEPLDLEIIVSDANSTDRTADIVRRFQALWGRGRLRLVQAAGPQNIAIGRNLGAAQARGELLFHLDADVRIPQPERFFAAVRRRFQDPRVAAATCPLWIYPEEAGASDRAWHIFTNTTIRLSFLAGVYLAKGECQLVRRAAFEAVGGYNERLVAGEDCNLFFRLHRQGRIAYLAGRCVYHSPRRFRQYGYARVSWIYLREGLSLLFRKRSYAREWTPVR